MNRAGGLLQMDFKTQPTYTPTYLLTCLPAIKKRITRTEMMPKMALKCLEKTLIFTFFYYYLEQLKQE